MTTIIPENIANFKNDYKNHFFLITSPAGNEIIDVASNVYESADKIVLDDFKDINYYLTDIIPDYSDILILPYRIDKNVRPKTQSIKPNSRVLSLQCATTGPSLEQIHYCLDTLYQSDCEEQERISKDFFALLDRQFNNKLFIRNAEYGSEAVLDIDEHCFFVDKSGFLKNGKHQITPSGEIAIAPKTGITDINGDTARLSLTGELILNGLPIVHRFCPEPFVTWRLVDNLYQSLKIVIQRPVVVRVSQGVIDHIEALDGKPHEAVNVLQSLLILDYRYANLTEVGCSFNTKQTLCNSNNAFNESYGGERGCLHFGIGGRNNSFHIDIIAPGSVIDVFSGERLIG